MNVKNILILLLIINANSLMAKEKKFEFDQIVSPDNTHIVMTNGLHNISLKCEYNKNVATCQYVSKNNPKFLIYVNQDNVWKLK